MEIKDVAGLSGPMCKLIECCSNALGAMAHPWQIERVANAETKAEIIKAKGEGQVAKIKWQSDSELSEIQQRAMQRVLHQEERKQRNIENIVAKALPEVKENAKPEDVEDDWYANFFDKSRLVSDEEMQMLWGKVLAGEVNQPGSFSRRLLSLLADLDKKDANEFLLICRFSYTKNNVPEHPLIFIPAEGIFEEAGFGYQNLTNLESMGLISYDSLGFMHRQYAHLENLRVNYFSTTLTLRWPSKWDGNLNVGHVVFTNLGQQLARMCSPQPYPGFENYLVQNWKKLGYKVTIQREGQPPQEA